GCSAVAVHPVGPTGTPTPQASTSRGQHQTAAATSTAGQRRIDMPQGNSPRPRSDRTEPGDPHRGSPPTVAVDELTSERSERRSRRRSRGAKKQPGESIVEARFDADVARADPQPHAAVAVALGDRR